MSVSRALLGSTVVVTRSAERAAPLVEALREAGAAVVELPVVRTEAAADGGAALSAAVSDVERFSWAAFTSTVAVARTLEAVGDAGRLRRVRMAAVGPATAAALAAEGFTVAVTAHPATAAGLVASMPAVPKAGARPLVLYPRAAGARDTLATGLRHKGYDVQDVEAYRTVAVTPDEGGDAVPRALGADAVVFTSPSTVDAFVALLPSPRAPTAVAACIGPVTADAARAAGFAEVVVADEPTPAGLVEALCRHAPDGGAEPTGGR